MTGAFAVVTGESTGIGRKLADQFAKHGHDLLITAEDANLDAVHSVLAKPRS